MTNVRLCLYILISDLGRCADRRAFDDHVLLRQDHEVERHWDSGTHLFVQRTFDCPLFKFPIFFLQI